MSDARPTIPAHGHGATIAGLGAIALWATLPPLSLLAKGVPPLLLTGVAFLAGGVLGLVMARLRGRPLVDCFTAPLVAWLLGVGGFFGFHLCYFLAFRHLPAIQALLIVNFWPLLIVLFSALVTGERLLPRHLGGALAGLVGAAVLVSGRTGATEVAPSLVGYFLAAAAALIWSGYSVLNRRFAADVPSEAVAAFCLGTGALGLLAHWLIEPAAELVPQDWVAVLLLAVGPIGLAFFLWDHGTKRGDIRLLGAASYLAPLLAAGLLVLIGASAISWRLLVAALLILGGAALAARPARPSPPPVEPAAAR